MPESRAQGQMLFCQITESSFASAGTVLWCNFILPTPLPFGGKVVNSQLPPPQIMLESCPKWAWFQKYCEVTGVHKPQSPSGSFGVLNPIPPAGIETEKPLGHFIFDAKCIVSFKCSKFVTVLEQGIFSLNTSQILPARQAKACLLKIACTRVHSPGGF